MVIKFEKRFMFHEWSHNAHPTLVGLVDTLSEVWPKDQPMRFTSLNRSKSEDQRLNASGIHSSGPPWRAVDIGGAEFEQNHLSAMAEFVNTHWRYDKNRPNLKCAVAKLHGTGKHIHLQVHKRTARNFEEGDNGNDRTS